MKHELLRMTNIRVSDKEINILNNFCCCLYKGEVLGIFVYNASEKQHLIDLILGNAEISTGSIYYLTQIVSYSEYAKLAKNRIALIQDVSKLIDNLSVAENIHLLLRKHRRVFIDKSEIVKNTQMLFDKLEVNIDPEAIVHTLNNTERTIIEIVKAFLNGVEVLVFKDFSSYFSDVELRYFENILARLKENEVTVVFIDSYSNIFKQYVNRLIVMKNGSNVWTFDKNEIDDQIISELFYTPHAILYTAEHNKRKSVLKFMDVSAKQLQSLSFELFEGELLSIIDQEGNSIEEIYDILRGRNINYSGQIFIGNDLYKISEVWESLNQGVAFVVENALENMLFKDMTVVENLSFASIGKLKHIWLENKYLHSCIDEYNDFFTKEKMNSIIGTLSLHDQQTLVYLKWYLYNPKILICVRPFSSVEAELREITLKMITMLLDRGISILILGSNYSELCNIGTEIIV